MISLWLLVLTSIGLRAYFGALNVVLIIFFSPITQETVNLEIRQRSQGPDTGSVATSLVYQVANPPNHLTCRCQIPYTSLYRPHRVTFKTLCSG